MKTRHQKSSRVSSSAVQSSTTSVSVRTLGTGEIGKIQSNGAGSCSPAPENCSSNHDDGHESFVVINFLASSPLLTTTSDEKNVAKSRTIVKQDTHTISSSSSNDDEEDDEGIVFDETTDLAYHNRSEREGSDQIYRALSAEERSAMPDEFMPLRHYRAEKGDIPKAINGIKLTLLRMKIHMPCHTLFKT